MIVVKGSFVLIICMLLSLLIACTASTSPLSDIDMSHSNTQTALLSVIGTPLQMAGINSQFVETSDIFDPNISDPASHGITPIASIENGKHTEISLQFADNVTTVETIPVISVQEFFVDGGDPENFLFIIETNVVTGIVKEFDYNTIANKLIYSDADILVVDISSFLQMNYRDEMQKYITSNQGNVFGHPAQIPQRELPLLADGTLIYKYDWIEPAFDYVTEHILEIIVLTPH